MPQLDSFRMLDEIVSIETSLIIFLVVFIYLIVPPALLYDIKKKQERIINSVNAFIVNFLSIVYNYLMIFFAGLNFRF